MPSSVIDYSVELPAGGRLHLQTADEVELWGDSLKKYREDYIFGKQNDLVSLGTLLQQQINIFRAQTAINGMQPQLDVQGVPTGRYSRVDLDANDVAVHQKTLTTASQEMRALEKSLGIDKGRRESGGAHTVDSYLTGLKKAGHLRGIHIAKRTLAYEAFVGDFRWRLRMLFNSDQEDRAYHNITPKSVLMFAVEELAKLEEVDKEFAREKGQLYAGKL